MLVESNAVKDAIKRKFRGFTLIELTVTCAVLAVLAAFAAPSFRQLLAAQNVRTTGYDIVGDLVLARSEALKRGGNVTIVPVASDWASGWSVNVTSTNEVLGGQGRVGVGVQFTRAPADITFDKNGRISISSVVRIGLYDGIANRRCISLDPSGRPKNTKSECPV